MIGQIKSYISLMNENNFEQLSARINNMINSLPDDENRTNLLNEFLIKSNHLKTALELKKKNTVEKVDIGNPSLSDIKKIEMQNKIKENEKTDLILDEKVKEYLKYKLNKNNDYQIKNKKTIIKINACNLIRIGNSKIILNRTLLKSQNDKQLKHSLLIDNKGIPSLPIYDE